MDQVSEKKKILKKRSIFLWSFFFVLAIFIFFFFFGNIKVINHKTFSAKIEMIERKETVSAFSIWDEELVFADYDGTMILEKKHGDRVFRGETVFGISKALQGQKLEQLKMIEDALMNISRGTTSTNALDIEVENVDTSMDAFRLAMKEGRFQDAKQCYGTIKDQKGQENQKKEYTQEELMDMRDAIIEEMNSVEKNYYATSPGILSFAVDSLEQRYNQNILKNSPSELWKGVESSQIRFNKSGDFIAKGESVCRIINNYHWYLGMEVKREAFQQLELGDLLSIRLHGDQDYELISKVQYKENKEEKYCMVLELSAYGDFFIDQRNIMIDLIYEKAKGIQIPKKSLYKWNQIQGVFVQDGNQNIIFKPIHILMEGESFVVADQERIQALEAYQYGTLKIYDSVIEDATQVSVKDVIFPKEGKE